METGVDEQQRHAERRGDDVRDEPGGRAVGPAGSLGYRKGERRQAQQCPQDAGQIQLRAAGCRPGRRQDGPHDEEQGRQTRRHSNAPRTSVTRCADHQCQQGVLAQHRARRAGPRTGLDNGVAHVPVADKSVTPDCGFNAGLPVAGLPVAGLPVAGGCSHVVEPTTVVSLSGLHPARCPIDMRSCDCRIGPLPGFQYDEIASEAAASDRRGMHGAPFWQSLPGALYPSQPRTFTQETTFGNWLNCEAPGRSRLPDGLERIAAPALLPSRWCATCGARPRRRSSRVPCAW